MLQSATSRRLLFLLSFHTGLIHCQIDVSSYPPCAANIFNANVPAKCNYEYDALDTYGCLCASSDYVGGMAHAIYSQCGCSVLEQSAVELIDLCNLWNQPSVLSCDQIVSAGDNHTSTCPSASCSAAGSAAASSSSASYISSSSPSSTPTAFTTSSYPSSSTRSSSSPSSSPSNPNNNDSPKSDRIALDVGLGVGIPTCLIGVPGCIVATLALIAYYKKKKRKKKEEEEKMKNGTTEVPPTSV